MLGIGAATAVVAPNVVFSAPEVAPVATAPAVVSGMEGGIRGLPYLVANSGTYFGLDTRRRVPTLKASSESTAGMLTRCKMENFKRKVYERSMMDQYNAATYR